LPTNRTRHPDPARYGPTALVTGASSGIGRACAGRLAAAGFDLVLVARSAPALQAVADALAAAHGVNVRVVAADLATPGAAAAVIEATADVDVGLLVAAAGFGSSGPFLAQDTADELGMIDLNCRAVVDLAHRVGQRLALRGRGGIVLFGSLVGWQGVPNSATYGATKAFVQSFAEGLHAELRPRGVDVLSVAPGPVASDFGTRARMRMGLTDRPETVARAALAALGRRQTVVPGRIGRILTWSLAALPRRARTAIMGRIMAGMAQGHAG
jgi:short-subunit dehydrogenase